MIGPRAGAAALLLVALATAIPGCTDDRPTGADRGRRDDTGLERVATIDGLPTAAVRSPDGSAVLVSTQDGRILRIGSDETPAVELALGDRVAATGEQGLANLLDLGDGRLAASFSSSDGRVVIAAWKWDRAGAIEADSEAVLLEVPSPLPYHKGGGLALDGDGNLLAAIGDMGFDLGGAPVAQDPSRRLGAIVRIPTASGGDPEVLAIGLRNPWRITSSLDGSELLVGDVGDQRVEELDRLALVAGGISNFGWPRYEGDELVRPDLPEPVGYVAPIRTWEHDESTCGIVLGPWWQGATRSDLDGHLVVGDLCSREVHALAEAGTGRSTLVALLPERPISLHSDPRGGILVAGSEGGVYRVARAASGSTAGGRASTTSAPAASATSSIVVPTTAPGGFPELCQLPAHLERMRTAMGASPTEFRTELEAAVGVAERSLPDVDPPVRTALATFLAALVDLRSAAAAADWQGQDPEVVALLQRIESAAPPYDAVGDALTRLFAWGDATCAGHG